MHCRGLGCIDRRTTEKQLAAMIDRTWRTRFRHFAYGSRLVRYAAWRLSLGFGSLRRTFVGGRRSLFLLLAVEELVAFVGFLFLGRLDQAIRGALYIFFFWIAQVVVVVLAQARRRVVVEQFTDATGDTQRPDSRGLATLLVGELAEFRDLYSAVDERAIPTAVQKSRPLAATIKVDYASDFLESPAVIEAKASIGPIQVPIGALLAFLGQIVRGPRLFGGVHVEEGSLVLAAQLSHQKDLRTWRVERPLATTRTNGRREIPQEMVTELACRMFGELALGGPVRWEAIEAFAAALASIRQCLRSAENRRLKLQQAERSLIQALKEDEQLGYVYYNLGVVFTELRRLAQDEREHEKGTRCTAEAHAHWNAAERAFRRQIAITPDRWEAYYALAMTYKSREPEPQWDYVLKRCDRVASMSPGHATTAKVLLLKSDANDSKEEPALMVKNRRMALGEAWSALCGAARSGRGVDETEAHLAASALKGLAVALSNDKRGLPAELRHEEHMNALHLLGRAVKLAPNDAEIRFELGSIAKSIAEIRRELGLKARRKRERAIREIDAALRIDPRQPKYWTELALLHARSSTESGDGEAAHATYCCEQALQLVDCYEREKGVKETVRGVAAVYRELPGDHDREARCIREMRVVARLCGRANENGAHANLDEASVACLRDMAQQDDWAGAQASIALGHVEFGKANFKEAAGHFKRAIDALERRYPEEIVRRELRILYAKALQKHDQPEHDEALEELRQAIGDNPLDSAPRAALADAYSEIHDFRQAERVLRDALRWDPDNPDLHRKLGRCRWRLAQDQRSAGGRERALRKAVSSFQQTLELSQHHELSVQLVTHYWLARLYTELGEYERAIPFLRRATICVGGQPLVHLLLGEAYVRAKVYEAGEIELRRAIRKARFKPLRTEYGHHFEDPRWDNARIRTYARTLLAFSYAERGVKLAPAAAELQKARRTLKFVKLEQHVAEAACEDAAGLVALQAGRVTEAIMYFKLSLAALPQAETYVHTARAYLARLDRDPTDAMRWVRLGEEALRRAKDLDPMKLYSRTVNEMLAEFSAAKDRLRPSTDAEPQHVPRRAASDESRRLDEEMREEARKTGARSGRRDEEFVTA
jgi:tetratricopeptide (TPR) repeat protein